MLCPNCRSEMANQTTCPYCGTFNQSAYAAKHSPYGVATQPVNELSPNSMLPTNKSALKKTHRDLDVKLLLILVLQCGNFLLTLLMLIIFALK